MREFEAQFSPVYTKNDDASLADRVDEVVAEHDDPTTLSAEEVAAEVMVRVSMSGHRWVASKWIDIGDQWQFSVGHDEALMYAEAVLRNRGRT